MSEKPSKTKTFGEAGRPTPFHLSLAVKCKRCNPAHVKYWEIIADNLSKAGWSWGWCQRLVRKGQTIWIADAHRGDGKRFVVRGVASESFALQTPSG